MKRIPHHWLKDLRVRLDEVVVRTSASMLSSRSKGMKRRGIELSALEPRILYSATPIDAAPIAPIDSAETVAVAEPTSAPISETTLSTQTTTEIVIVDPLVAEIDSILEDLNHSGKNYEVFVLNADQDGVEQISEILAGRSDVDALHLVSHAYDGEVRLGNTWLGTSRLEGYAGQIAMWQTSFATDGDILIYGCDLAMSSDGQTLIEAISELTGTDVTASNDRTGHVDLGADWELEYSTGIIETEVAFSESFQDSWQHQLIPIVVDTEIDEEIANGLTSLREAITLAGNGDTIFLGSHTYHLTIDTLDIDKNVTIIGIDARSTIIDATGLGKRAFELVNNANVSMSRMAITGGVENNGGGIFVNNNSTLNLSDAMLYGNSSNDGGAIHVHGTANLNRVTLYGNTASEKGGAIAFHNAIGGTLVNVTVSGNTATKEGGGVWTDSSISINYSTITNNHGRNGGGIENLNSTVTIANSIVAGNTADHSSDDILGTFVSDGSNLIQVVGSANGFASDITGVSASLGALANNGGLVDTHALLSGSLAIGSAGVLDEQATDARGVAREVTSDIGAYALATLTTTSESLVTIGNGSTETLDWIERGTPNSVTILSNGNYVVVWSSDVEPSDSDFRAYARVFAADGTSISGEILLSQTASNQINQVSVDADAAGNFVATWVTSSAIDSSKQVYARRFNAGGTPLGGEFLVHADSGDVQRAPMVSVNKNTGDFVITWDVAPQSLTSKIYAQRFNADGSTPSTNSFIEVKSGFLTGPTTVVETTSDGGFIVQWESVGNIVLKRYDASGDLIGSEVSVYSDGISDRHDLAVHSDGSFLSVWTQNDWGPIDIWMQRFDSLGAKIGTSSIVNTLTSGSQVAPSIDMALDGSFVIGWTGNGASDNEDIYARKFSADGNALDVEFLVNQSNTGAQQNVSIGVLDLNNFVIVWDGVGTLPGQTDTTGIFSRAYGTFNSAPIANAGGPYLVNEGGTLNLDASGTTDAEGNTLSFAWDLNNDGTFGDVAGETVTVSWSTLVGYGRNSVAAGPYTIGLRVNDGNGGIATTSTTFAIINTAPTGIALSSTSVTENLTTSPGFILGNLSASDANNSDTFTYSIVGGADQSKFVIGGASGSSLYFNDGLIDYERQTSYQVRIRVTDSGANTFEQTFDIAVVDLNDVAPSIGTSQVFTVPENAANSTSLGFVSATDPDSVGALTNWMITGGNVGGVFHINSSTGELTVQSNANLDYETTQSYSLSIRVGDGANTSTNETVVVNVINVAELNALWISTSGDVTASGNPDLPAWDEGEALQFDGNAMNFEPNGGTTTGTLTQTGFRISNFGAAANVRVEGIHYVWSDLTVGTGLNSFDLHKGDLLLTVDRDSVTLTNSDAGIANQTFNKNDIFVFRPDNEGDYTEGNFYQLLQDPLGAVDIYGVSLVGSAGGVTVGDATLSQGTFLFVRDGAADEDRIYTFNATDVGATTSGTSNLLLEGSDGGNLNFSQRIDAIHIVEATGTIGNVAVQAGDILMSTYNVASVSGVSVEDQDIVLVRMTNTRLAGTESNGSAMLFLDGSDLGFNPLDASEDIDAITFAEAVVFSRPIGPVSDTNTSSNEVSENATIGTTVGITARAIDLDSSDTVTYSLDDSADSRFAIHSTTGVVTLASSLDYESATSHSIVVRATSSDTSFQTIGFTIAVLDFNDIAPIVTAAQTFSVQEHATIGTTLGQVAFTDPDTVGSPQDWTIVSGDPQNIFSIHSTTGELTVANNAPLNFETASTHTLNVRVFDGVNYSTVVPITVNVIDQNDSPSVQLTTVMSAINENTNLTASQLVATIQVVDDAIGTNQLFLSGADASLFEIKENGSELHLKAGVTLDFETKPSFYVVVNVNDPNIGGAVDDTDAFSLSVQNLNDAATGSPTISGTTTSGQVLTANTSSIQDEDGLGALTYVWRRDGNAIPLANSSSYVLTTADVGHQIQVAVSFVDGGGANEGPLLSAATTTILSPNHAPTLQPFATSVVSGQTLTIPASMFQSLSHDPDGDSLTAILVASPSSGSLTLLPTGEFQYRSAPGVFGDVMFVWKANDGSLESPASIVTITVIPAVPSVPSTPPPAPPQNVESSTSSGNSESDAKSDESIPIDEGTEAKANESETNSDSARAASSPSTLAHALEILSQSMERSSVNASDLTFLDSSISPRETGESSVSASNQSPRQASQSYHSETTNRSSTSDANTMSRIPLMDFAIVPMSNVDYTLMTQPGAMWEQLDDNRSMLAQSIQGDLIVVGTAGAAASSVTVGVVAWGLRTGFLGLGLVAQVPAWRSVDPMLIMQRAAQQDSGESLEELMDRRNKEIDETL